MHSTVWYAYKSIVTFGIASILTIFCTLYVQQSSQLFPEPTDLKFIQDSQALLNLNLRRRQQRGPEVGPAGQMNGRPFDFTNGFSEEKVNAETATQTGPLRELPGVKSIIIIAYQRSGSTFLGNLFDSDPRAFHIFEPLDALYTSLYGTVPGWNVPSDIVTFSNGSERVIPENEEASVVELLSRLVNCEVSRLPIEFLVHKYWRDWTGEKTNEIGSYRHCLLAGRHIQDIVAPIIHSFCGYRFGEQSPTRELECNGLMNDAEFRRTYGDQAMAGIFTRYRQRMDIRVRFTLERSCLPLLAKQCSSHQLRIVKLVRAGMSSMDKFMRSNPDSYVIHLVRDPRPVVWSRMNFSPSGRALFTDETSDITQRLVREASIYCRQVAADAQWRQRLEREHPGRLLSLTYEQLASDPAAAARNIYEFVGEQVPMITLQEFVKLSTRNANKTASFHAMKWRNATLTKRESDKKFRL